MKVGHHLPVPFRAALPNAIFKDRLCHKHAPRGAGGSATGLSATGAWGISVIADDILQCRIPDIGSRSQLLILGMRVSMEPGLRFKTLK